MEIKMIGRRSMIGGLFATPIVASARAKTNDDFKHPNLSAAADLFARARWQDLADHLNTLPPQSALVLLGDLGESTASVAAAPDLDAFADAKGGAGLAGAMMIVWAWLSRGTGNRVTNPEEFSRRLLIGKSYLEKAVSDDADDGIALTASIRCAKGFGDRDHLRELLPKLLLARRTPVGGLTEYANALTERWGGSDEDLLGFARHHVDAMPPASFGLIADAHADIAMNKWARDLFSSKNPIFGMQKFLEKGGVPEEIVDAHNRFIALPANLDDYAMRLAHAQFSLVFRCLNKKDLLNFHIERQGSYIDGAWRMLPGAKSEIKYLRRRIG